MTFPFYNTQKRFATIKTIANLFKLYDYYIFHYAAIIYDKAFLLRILARR